MTLPLAAYYGIALAVPLANGAAKQGAAFWKHAFVVFILPLIWIALGSAISGIVRDVQARRPTRFREREYHTAP